ncbi:hypothetical protein TD95_004801 [Thielaviopsis punctulata]|uniref:G-patch domain-containing protein n=1 Tax=Thielaviopsis punctulata TaxID=72032 RepID=A0A0F4ZH52_9PEZI|nr:hypothetical protein TD95_004801 [Thielaviopsis punctulata]
MSQSDYVADCDSNQNEEDVPLHRKNVFSSGIRRQKVAFVKASSVEPALALGTLQESVKSSGIADAYLSLVMGSGSSEKDSPSFKKGSRDLGSPVMNTETTASPEKPPPKQITVCDMCKVSIDITADPNAWTKHEASLAHQVSLAHSPPPSALDRSRMGLAYLESHGWDPDARQGLGAVGQGRQYPIKPVVKEDTQGIGFREDDASEKKKAKQGADQARTKVKKMSAKDRKREELEQKRKAEKLHEEFYASDDVLRYMSTGRI